MADDQQLERLERTMKEVADDLKSLIREVSHIRANEQIVENRFSENGRRVGKLEDDLSEIKRSFASQRDLEMVEKKADKVSRNQNWVATIVLGAVIVAVVSLVINPSASSPSSVITKSQ